MISDKKVDVLATIYGVLKTITVDDRLPIAMHIGLQLVEQRICKVKYNRTGNFDSMEWMGSKKDLYLFMYNIFPLMTNNRVSYSIYYQTMAVLFKTNQAAIKRGINRYQFEDLDERLQSLVEKFDEQVSTTA
jgi:hypothetical protein